VIKVISIVCFTFICFTIGLSQSGYPCFIIESSVNQNAPLAIGTNIRVAPFLNDAPEIEGIWIDEIYVGGSPAGQITFSDKLRLRAYLKCMYKFEKFQDTGSFTILTYEADNGALTYVITGFGTDVSYFIHESYLYELRDCNLEEACSNRSYKQAEFDSFERTVKRTPDEVQVNYIEATFDTLTELYLKKSAYISLYAAPAVYDTQEVIILTEELVSCSGFPVDYISVEDTILIKDEYPTFTISPAQFETVTEQVLVKEGSILFDTLTVDYNDSLLNLTLLPEHTNYFWTVDETCSNSDPFECIQIDSMINEEVGVSLTEYFVDDCPTDFSISGNLCWKLVEVPSIFETITRLHLVEPASSVAQIIDAEYHIFTKQLISESTPVPDSCVTMVYDTITVFNLIEPATLVSIEIPAEYAERNFERLDTPAFFDVLVSLSDTLYNGQHLIEDGFCQIRENICDDFLTDELKELIVQKLMTLGYIVDPNLSFGDVEFWDGLFRFQEDNNIYIGQIDVLTLFQLGIN